MVRSHVARGFRRSVGCGSDAAMIPFRNVKNSNREGARRIVTFKFGVATVAGFRRESDRAAVANAPHGRRSRGLSAGQAVSTPDAGRRIAAV